MKLSRRSLANAKCTSTAYAYFPQTKIPYTSKLDLQDPRKAPYIPCYRVTDWNGKTLKKANEPKLGKTLTLKIYKNMICLHSMDSIFFDAQRQGRVPFFITSSGEEAVGIATAAAVHSNDMLFLQYRELGALLYRGFTYQQFADQLFGNVNGHGIGRQMPCHFGSKELNVPTLSSPLATQIPHSVGAAYAFKMQKMNQIAVCYIGEGAASEGDFHAGLNVAATKECPILFIIRNNGYAISTPNQEQYRGDGIASRGIGYGISYARVDGNDAIAIFEATRRAREYIMTNMEPFLLELMTYRVGHHSTSDDSTRYRSVEEINRWKENYNPITRLKGHIIQEGWWSEDDDLRLRETERTNILNAIHLAEKKGYPSLETMFEDVYDRKSYILADQETELQEHIAKYPDYHKVGK